jgi:aminoglycoside phosphotransferase (APT) family kinase protein
MKYSDRLGEISKNQLQLALNEFSLGSFIKAEPVKEGLFGQNLFIISSKGEYVLRGCPHNDWQFKSEKFFVNKLNKRTTIPVPYPYNISTNKNIFGWDFVVMPKLEGINLSSKMCEESLDKEDRVEIAKEQGTSLVEMQRYTESYCGYYDLTLDDIKPIQMKYSDRMYKNIYHRLNQAIEVNSNLTSDTDTKWVEGILKKGDKYLTLEFTPTYVMQDYKPENMLVKKVDSKWRISGVFDLMESYIGNGESDLSRMYSMYLDNNRKDLAEIFLNEFLKVRANTKLDSGFRERFNTFMIHDRVIVWSWSVRINDIQESMKNGFRSWLKKYLI